MGRTGIANSVIGLIVLVIASGVSVMAQDHANHPSPALKACLEARPEPLSGGDQIEEA